MEINNRNVIAFQIIKNAKKLYDSDTRKTPAFLDLDTYFPEYKILEENWETMRDEILQVLEESTVPQFHEIDSGQEFISNNDNKAWNVFVVKCYGMWLHRNAEKCPKTCALFKDMKHVKTINFSILAPGKYIPPHEGPYKGIIRYQLPLEVPKKGECYIIVDGRRHYWNDGESVLFDDTYTHEVHNKTDERRIALLLDIKRDDLNTPMRIFDWFYYKLFQAYIIAFGGLKKGKVD